MKKAIVIIPTYNEKENIQKVVPVLQDVFKNIKNWDMHILVVDDTSPDKTYETVQQLQKKHKNLHLVINPNKAGLGGAYLKGMAEAFGKLKADVVFEFDADLSHDPTKIPALLQKIEDGYDLVLGSRYVKGGGIPDDWGWHRKFLSKVGNLIIMLVFTDFSIRDWTAGYRAITRQVYEAVHPELHSERFSGYTFQIGFLHKTVRKGFKVAEVPFKFVDRTIGQSKLGPEYIKNTLIYIFKVRLQEIVNHRIFKFVVVGGLGALIQLSSLQLYRALTGNGGWGLSGFQWATLLSIETAIISNFILNNLWTFADRKLSAIQLPGKFVQFNIASMGSLIIQFILSTAGEKGIGLFTLFTLPIINLAIDTGLVYAVMGILIGMFWNFFAYSRLVWKKPASK
ncbi:MAG TPA: glycosyltransferase family 2 protein [Vitreimonas sp.]|nr:glycosyltransferase family 2 protein [Vitreimonas sp.]